MNFEEVFVMFGTLFAAISLSAIGLLLSKIVLKNEKLKPEQRQQAFLLTIGAAVFLVLVALLSLKMSSWSSIYSEPPITSGQDLDPSRNAWTLIQATVKDEPLAEKQRGYAAYVEYIDGVNGSSGVREFRGDQTLRLELEDGTEVLFQGFPKPGPTWNWHGEGAFRFLQPGDTVFVEGRISKWQSSEEEKNLYGMYEVEYLYRGGKSDFDNSLLVKTGKMSRYTHLTAALISVLGAVLTLGFALKNRKP